MIKQQCKYKHKNSTKVDHFVPLLKEIYILYIWNIFKNHKNPILIEKGLFLPPGLPIIKRALSLQRSVQAIY